VRRAPFTPLRRGEWKREASVRTRPSSLAAIDAAVAEARKRCRGLPLIAGGKSFGGRMTSQAQAMQPLGGVQGLAFLDFPLHPPDKPAVTRAEHLSEVRTPTLFVQGTLDELSDFAFLKPVTKSLGKRATVHLVDQAVHAFHVPARSGPSNDDIIAEIIDAFSIWTDCVLAN
jgi:predicted alpha/beta-hydrolase family hydrolase